ncbi:MAG: hypothetical protein H0T72_08275, partial [Chloroflexia bacterium]|nr:hypothetical protein [Chloroflexia bacterium]
MLAGRPAHGRRRLAGAEQRVGGPEEAGRRQCVAGGGRQGREGIDDVGQLGQVARLLQQANTRPELKLGTMPVMPEQGERAQIEVGEGFGNDLPGVAGDRQVALGVR